MMGTDDGSGERKHTRKDADKENTGEKKKNKGRGR